MERIKMFFKEDEGVTAIEYGIIAALMAAALVVAVGLITGGLNSAFTKIGNILSGT
jgi:pilus assembly protein Flp/PilA